MSAAVSAAVVSAVVDADEAFVQTDWNWIHYLHSRLHSRLRSRLRLRSRWDLDCHWCW